MGEGGGGVIGKWPRAGIRTRDARNTVAFYVEALPIGLSALVCISFKSLFVLLANMTMLLDLMPTGVHETSQKQMFALCHLVVYSKIKVYGNKRVVRKREPYWVM